MYKNTVKSWNYSTALRCTVLRAFTYCTGEVEGVAYNSSYLPHKKKKGPDDEILSSFFHLKEALARSVFIIVIKTKLYSLYC